MAQQETKLYPEKFLCSICLDLLKDPVALSCGHSYCMKCIEAHWDGEDLKTTYSCPQCRKTFTPRPDLEKNVLLAELVEELKKTGLQAAAADDLCYAGDEDVSCDVCTGRKRKAVKSCLFCLVSYCEKHLQPHYDVAPLKKHQLVEPSKNLQENICSRHNEVIMMFCRSDQNLICYLCSVDGHKGHDIVSAAAERSEKQKKLEPCRQKVQQIIQDRQKDVELLQQEMKDIKVSADKSVEDSKNMFSEMIHLIQTRSSEVEQQIRSQQETEESRVKELKEKLEQEIIDLEKKDAELKQISDLEDPNQFLKKYPSASTINDSKPLSTIIIRPRRYFEDVTAAVKDLRDKVKDIPQNTWTNISLAITEVDVLLTEPEPKTRDGFLKYSQEITLDRNTTNTAHTELYLSDGDRKVTVHRQQQKQQRTCHDSTRLTSVCWILSRESLTRRCYWEVEWKANQSFDVAVSYKDTSRTGSTWFLCCSSNQSYTFRYDNTTTYISGRWSSRIGVYLDHRAGILSFYSVSGTMTLLHRVQTTFTEPLHAGVRLYYDGDTAKFIKPE